jgi:hypothetical protein
MYEMYERIIESATGGGRSGVELMQETADIGPGRP